MPLLGYRPTLTFSRDLAYPDAPVTKTYWTFRSSHSFSTNMFIGAPVQYAPVSTW